MNACTCMMTADELNAGCVCIKDGVICNTCTCECHIFFVINGILNGMFFVINALTMRRINITK